MKKLAILLAALLVAVGIYGCKSPDQIEQDVQNGKTTQEIVIKQELEREQRTLKVTGIGIVDAAPDVATVQLSVSVHAATAEEAQQRNSELTAAVLDTIKSMGLREEHIKTQEVAVYPVQEQDRPAGEGGYTASNTISLRIAAVNRTGAIVSAAMQAGANELLLVEFHLLEETEAYREALAAAMEDAKAKAELMAPAINVDLNGPGYVLESTVFSSDTSNIVRYETPIAMDDITSDSGSLATPLQAGMITVRAEVTIEYMLKYPAAPTPTPN